MVVISITFAPPSLLLTCDKLDEKVSSLCSVAAKINPKQWCWNILKLKINKWRNTQTEDDLFKSGTSVKINVYLNV